MSLEIIESHKCMGGIVRFYRHASTATRTDMTFSVFLPPQAAAGKVPILYFLSGLSCTAENFTTKAGAQRFAAAAGLLLVVPDTSPRGARVPGEDDSYDLGTGAGFYINATTSPWARNYRMYDYVVHELPELVKAHLPAQLEREGIFGHSMGGHGALVCALKNPGRYRSVSALSPICAPSRCPWGEKAFTAYLGADRSAWAAYDASQLIAGAAERLPILIDQGLDDQFLSTQLMPEALVAAAEACNHPLTLRQHEGYDHGYYFVASFVGDHIEHHGRALRG